MNYKWFIGIDIAKKTLDVVLYKKELQKKSPYCQILNNSDGFKYLMNWLKEQNVVLKHALVCMESTGIYGMALINFISEKTNYCVESPLHIKRSLGLTRGKSDKIDAFQIARFCYLHSEELLPSRTPSKIMLTLRSLINERERLVKTRTIDKIIVKELSREENRSCIERAENRINILTEDIIQIEKEIKLVLREDLNIEQNYNLAKSVTGIGLVNAVMFILFTNNFNSITDARKYACYSGIAPFEHSSGTSIQGKTRVSKLSNKRIKVNLTNGARSAIINDPELKLYYKRKKDEGKEHGTIMNAVKFKLITRVFATIKRGTPYVKLRLAG
ncbi:IS110 family transposase [Bacteroidota bacterium]